MSWHRPELPTASVCSSLCTIGRYACYISYGTALYIYSSRNTGLYSNRVQHTALSLVGTAGFKWRGYTFSYNKNCNTIKWFTVNGNIWVEECQDKKKCFLLCNTIIFQWLFLSNLVKFSFLNSSDYIEPTPSSLLFFSSFPSPSALHHIHHVWTPSLSTRRIMSLVSETDGDSRQWTSHCRTICKH